MNAVDEKAKKVCRQLKLPDDGVAFIKIRLALKEQDGDTRHACAEAVVALEELPDGGGISKTLAHNACMNVKAI